MIKYGNDDIHSGQIAEDIWTLSQSDRVRKRKRFGGGVGGGGIIGNGFVVTDNLLPPQSQREKKKPAIETPARYEQDKSYKRYEVRQPKRGSAPSMYYAQRTPYPTYSQFGNPQMVDTLGRQYKWADGSDAELLQSMGKTNEIERGGNTDFSNPRDQNGQSSLLYLRFPRGQRGRIDFPEPGTFITFFDIKKGFGYRGKVEWVEGYHPVTSATGSVFIRNIHFVGCGGGKGIGNAAKNVRSNNANEELAQYYQDSISKLPKKYRPKKK